MSIISEEKKQKVLQDFLEYLEEGYDKEILTCEIFWEMDDYYRTTNPDIIHISTRDVEDFLTSNGWDVKSYN